MSKARRTLLPGTTRASASALSLRILPFLSPRVPTSHSGGVEQSAPAGASQAGGAPQRRGDDERARTGTGPAHGSQRVSGTAAGKAIAMPTDPCASPGGRRALSTAWGSGRARTSHGPRSAAQQAARLTRDSTLENRKLSLTHLSACGLRCRLRAERGGMFARRREKG